MELLANETTLNQVAPLVEYAFNKSASVTSDPHFMNRYRHAWLYGHYTDEVLSNFVMANQFHVAFHGETLPMAGIGYVASLPEFRGKGEMTHLFRDLLADLQAKGVILAELAPFSQAFYRRFGFESTIWQKHYQVATKEWRLQKQASTSSIRRGTFRDSQLLAAVKKLWLQQSQQKAEAGSILREEWWWQHKATYKGGQELAVSYDLQNAQQATGYVLYRRLGSRLVVDELVSQNETAVYDLLAFIGAHVSSFDTIELVANLHQWFEWYFVEQNALTITLQPYMMTRIINFPALLQKWFKATAAMTVTFEVTADPCCPWNVGCWKVKQENGAVSVDQATEQASVTLSGDIAAWTNLFFGQQTLDQLLACQQLVGSANEDVNAQFSKKTHAFYDYF